MKKSSVIFLLLLPLVVFSQDISKERIVNIVSTLASDEMKGRKFGTQENDRAAEYIASEFKKNSLDTRNLSFLDNMYISYLNRSKFY